MSEPAQTGTSLRTVVNVSDDTHVTDVALLVHKATDLLDGKLHHLGRLGDFYPARATKSHALKLR